VTWSKVKITKADTPTIRMDCHSILTNWCPNLCHPHHFTPDTLPGSTLPIYPALGQAPNVVACIPCGCPDKCVKIVQSFHDGMLATVLDGGSASSMFSVTSGAKQGCVSAPLLFSIFFASSM